MHQANNLRHMFNAADSLYSVMSKAQGLELLAISVLLQACDIAGLSNAAVQLVWATDESSGTDMHLHLQYLAKARRCCSPKDSMLAQSALVSRPAPASLDTLSKRGPSCTCLRTWHISWSDGTARMLLEDGEAALPLVSSALAPPLDVASLPVSKMHVS